METQTQFEQFSSHPFWNSVEKTWPDIKVINKTPSIGDNLNTLVTFCPLYQPVAVNESALLSNPTTIVQSRVAGKWNGLKAVLSSMQTSLTALGKNLNLTAVLANKGVLLEHSPRPIRLSGIDLS